MSNRHHPAVVPISQARVLSPFVSGCWTHSSSHPGVIVRHAEPADSAALHKLFTHPEIAYWTVELPFTTADQVHQRVMQQADGHYLLTACAGPTVIGSLTLSTHIHPRLRHGAQMGALAVHPDHQGKGAGAALVETAIDMADNWLNLQRLELYVYCDNAPAVALYRKFGFQEEGVLRHRVFRGGQYVNLAIMARIKGDTP